MDEIEIELGRERENGNRLAAALALLLGTLRDDDSTLHVLIGKPDYQLTVGHVVAGAFALHRETVGQRPEL